jgi:DNA-binding IclR family transcriptional regulator
MSNGLKLGLKALEFLAEAPRSAAEVGRHLHVDRSTAWRILQVLVEQDWVGQGTGPRPFSLNVSHLYRLAGNGHEHLALPGLVTPTLTRIRDRVGESAVFGVPSSTSMVYLVLVPSHHVVTIRESIGSVRPMHASALGKAFLSALSPDEFDALAANLDFQGATDRAVKTVPDLRQTVAIAREQGYATDLEECFPGVVCVAAPVQVGIDRLVIGSIGINGPRERLLMMGVAHVASVIKEEVAQLEAHFALASHGGSSVQPSVPVSVEGLV